MLCRIYKWIALLSVVGILTLVVFPSKSASPVSEDRKNILVICSYYQDDPWEKNILSGIKEELNKRFKNVNYDVEYMDARRHSGEQYVRAIYEVYKHKFKNTKYDVIVVCDNDALNFVLKYHDELFQDTPVVFTGINNYVDSMIAERQLFTGVAEDIDIKSTIDLALRLHSNTNKIIFITDKSVTGSAIQANVKSIIPYYGEGITAIQYQMDNIKDIKEKVIQLEKNSVIFFVGAFRDEDGSIKSLQESIEMVSKISQCPIYTCWDFSIGYGALGGVITEGKKQGELTAAVLARVLQGEKPSDIPVVRDKTNTYMFDFYKLEQFNIDNSLLPQNSIIINSPPRSGIVNTKILYGAISSLIIMVVVGIFIAGVNLYKRKKVERDLLERSQHLYTLINSSPDLICFKDGEGRWLEANEAILKCFELEDMYYKGKSDLELAEVRKQYKDVFLTCHENDEKAWQERTMFRCEQLIGKSEGEARVFDVLKIPLYNKDGSREGLIFTARDITEQKKNEEIKRRAEEDRRLYREALEYDMIRTEFFANISHELRTPLNVLFSALQLMDMYAEKGDIIYKNPETGRRTYIIKQNALRLLRLVNNLIDITKIDSGFFELQLQNKNIVEVVEDISLSVVDYIRDKGIELVFDTDVEEKILAFDPDKIERIILNLLSNAVKFTPVGGIIEVQIKDNGEEVSVLVKDNGIGIQHDKQRIIFDRFRQVDKSLARNREGSGIGLSLVKSLVELHGGSISVCSTYGEGSCFTFTLPVREVRVNPKDIEKELKTDLAERVNLEFSDIYS